VSDHWRMSQGEEARLTPGALAAAEVWSRGFLPLRVRTEGVHRLRPAFPGTAVVLGETTYEVLTEIELPEEGRPDREPGSPSAEPAREPLVRRRTGGCGRPDGPRPGSSRAPRPGRALGALRGRPDRTFVPLTRDAFWERLALPDKVQREVLQGVARERDSLLVGFSWRRAFRTTTRRSSIKIC